jgi:hypothetical protein
LPASARNLNPLENYMTDETSVPAVDETTSAVDTQAPAVDAAPPAVDTPLTEADDTVDLVAIDGEAHEEAKGIFASLASKLENFEHSLAADALAEIAKLKALLHL